MNIDSVPISNFMSSRGVITEREHQNIYSVCRIMHENNIGCVVIVGKNGANYKKPVGIITESDVIYILGSLSQDLRYVPLCDIMSKPLITISIDSSIKDAIQTMQQENIRHLVIVDKERMVSMITEKDIFRGIMNNQALIPSLLSNELLTEHKTLYNQFSEYWFGDILHKR
jgi:CBS domain-containing protein